MTGRVLLASIGLAMGSLSLGLALGGQWAWIPLVAAVAAVWLLGLRRGWDWTGPGGLVCYTGMAAAGLLLDLQVGWMVLAMVSTLTAWDLDHFVRRLKRVDGVGPDRSLERRHLLRLLMVDGVGLLLGAIALQIEVRLTFATILLLVLLAAVGLGQAIRFLRRESD
jgi:hypothetical protein